MQKGNMSTGWIIFLVLVVLVGGYFLISGDNDELPNDSETMDENSTSTEQIENADNNVTYTDEGFSPSSLTVSSGETVTFMNDSNSGMWVASAVHPTHDAYDGTTMDEHCEEGTSETFDACEEVSSGESWSFTFERTGEWNYHNHVNSGDTGTIIVE